MYTCMQIFISVGNGHNYISMRHIREKRALLPTSHVKMLELARAVLHSPDCLNLELQDK